MVPPCPQPSNLNVSAAWSIGARRIGEYDQEAQVTSRTGPQGIWLRIRAVLTKVSSNPFGKEQITSLQKMRTSGCLRVFVLQNGRGPMLLPLCKLKGDPQVLGSFPNGVWNSWRHVCGWVWLGSELEWFIKKRICTVRSI